MRRTVLLALLAVLSGPAPSVAGPTWLEPAVLGSAISAGPVAATSPNGESLVAWIRNGMVEARLRGTAGSYAPAVALGSGAGSLDAAMAADGTAVVAWIAGDKVLAAVRTPGAAGFGAPSDLTGGGSGTPAELQVRGNDRGDVIVAFIRQTPRAARRPAGADWAATQELSTGPACALSSAVGTSGHAAVAWRAGCGAGADAVTVALAPPGAAFGATQAAAPDETGVTTAVAVDAGGRTAVAWLGTGAVRGVVVGGAAGPLSPDGQITGPPALAATPAGEFVAVWRAGTGGGARIVATRGTPGGFGTTGAISADGVDDALPLAVGAGDGSLVVGWLRAGILESARRAPGTGFTAAVPVSRAGAVAETPDLAADADGNAVAAYRRSGVVAAQALDAAGPQIVDVVARAGGFALDPYRFSFAVRDAWSAVASTAFRFPGDQRRAGPSTEFAFPTAGSTSFTMTAEDAVGNIRSLERPFLVGPPADRTPPILSDPKLDRTRFRVSRTPTAVVAQRRAARGTRLRYTLSEPAQVLIYFERVGFARQGGKRRRVFAPAGLITRAHPLAGRVSVGFSGRILARSGVLRVLDTTFRPGRYRVTLVAADAVRNVSKPVTLAFTIVR